MNNVMNEFKAHFKQEGKPVFKIKLTIPAIDLFKYKYVWIWC